MHPKYSTSLTTLVKSCQYPCTPLVQEAISLGFIVASIAPALVSPIEGPLPWVGSDPRPKLPAGHRFYPDCYREQEARFMSWLLGIYKEDSWFFTQTFRYWLPDRLAEGMQGRFLARLNQAYKEISRGELLKSISSAEWQRRGVIHYHLLIFGRKLSSLSRKRWERRWQMASGGLARCYEAHSPRYLVKHQVRDHPESSLSLGGAWRDINPPRSLERCCSASNDSKGEAIASQANVVSALV